LLKTNKPVKIAEEIGVKVSDYNKMKLILDKIFIKKIEYEKEGILYIKDGTIFGIDTIKGIPTFLEIEVKSIKTINKYVKILKLDKNKIRKWNAEKLFKHYKLI
jgi:predicted adenylyl cyclase CyaB